LSIYEIALVVAIFAGWFIHSSLQAVLSGFPIPHLSDKEALGILLTECITFPIAFAVLWVRGWRLKDLGIQVTWLNSFAGLLLFGGTLFLNVALWELFGHAVGGREFLREFSQAISVSFPVAVLLSVANGFFEEFFLCRYLVEAFTKFGPALAIGASALVRVMYHLYQGPLGAILVLGFGVAVTFFYWRFRQVWPAMLAHMLADLEALT
jgi:membrane protease YdiL (CAAX protease family)